MPWDTIVGLGLIAGVIGAVVWGKRAARKKEQRIAARAEAKVRAELGVMVSQTTVVQGDDRRSVAVGAANDGAAVDLAAIVRAELRAALRERDGSGVVDAGWAGAAVRPGGGVLGEPGPFDAPPLEAVPALPVEVTEADVEAAQSDPVSSWAGRRSYGPGWYEGD